MITGKRAFALVLCISICMTLLVSCKNDISDDALSKLEALGTGNNEEFSEYRIVIPASAEETVGASARSLADAISKRTGSRCITVFDNDAPTASDECLTFLLGNTCFDTTRSALYGLKRDDYICKLSDRTVVLGGRSEAATAAAVKRYINEVLPMCEPTRVICADGNFEYHCDYEIDELILCGFELDKYVFVCGEDKAAYALAGIFREVIADKCGYYPDILSEDNTAGRREISFEVNDSITSLSRICFDGEDIKITADSVFGLSVAAEKLYTMMTESSSNGKVSLDIEGERNYTYSHTNLSLINAVSDISADANGTNKAIELANYINGSGSAVVTMGALHADIWNIIKTNLSNKYTVSVETLPDGSMLPILVDFSVYSVDFESNSESDGSVSRKAYLTHKDSGQTFIVFELFAPDASKHTETVKNALSNAENACIAVFMSNDASTPFDVIGEHVSVEYNSGISSGELKYRCGIFSNADLLECSEVSVDKTLGTDVCVMSLSAEKLFCDAFVAIAGSKYIYN